MAASYDTVHEHEEDAHRVHDHPGPKQYVFIGVVLAIITAIEVAIYYIPALASLIVPLLIAFSVMKFMLVILWFMHLRFDARVFKRFFLVGVVLALSVFAVVLSTFFLRESTTRGPAPDVIEPE
ncbi:MAG: cytochrome C oxidase subunit IV family protein [Actinomycetota bacterium]